ncbi:probable prefoldin subunit 2 [Condylostylus longicornis]|uniref:probable prefoldin subunit 2 n=1 Tax=Condylostylus longicornis TaxID=2530218 RepID=UPI00244D9DB8|nr:probable prefoldin subunit 2 [Condylostylus longicornis]
MASEAAKAQKKQEKIIGDFQILRNEQRNLASKLTTLEMDLKEHKTVIETLKTVDEDRKCFRLIGGVLCERKVKDVLPQLIENRDNLEKTLEIVTDQLHKKGIELNNFKKEHNIKIRGQEPTANEESESKDKTEETSEISRNVLVSN